MTSKRDRGEGGKGREGSEEGDKRYGSFINSRTCCLILLHIDAYSGRPFDSILVSLFKISSV